MNKKKWKEALPSIVATGGVLAFSVAMFLMYGQSQLRLFYLSAIFLLLLASVNLLLLIFGKDRLTVCAGEKRSEAPPTEQTADDQLKKKKNSLGKALWSICRAVGLFIAKLFCKCYRVISLILLAAAVVAGAVWFGSGLWGQAPVANLQYWQLAVVGVMFVIAIVADNLCKHSDTENKRYAMLERNCCIFFKLSKVILVLIAADLALKLLGIYDIQTYVVWALAALFYYVAIFIATSLAVRAFRGELASAPGIVVLLPFMGADVKELSIVSFLEENTGITLRSLWSIKYVRSILPYTVVFAAFLLWASTGIVYVQSHQQAAVYRLGVLQEQTLTPGLHLTLPYPLDQTEIYDTETVNRLTIGYRSSENQDNVWNEDHGESEYRLLLGSGKELVSINLRLEYKISDLKRYLRSSSTPERILEAKAYELVTDRTIATDLETILATDREKFSSTFFDELSAEIKRVDPGVEVVSVVLESIHPPVEVAEVYQNFIAAEIDAEKYVLDAQADAASIRASAQTAKHEIINYAHINHSTSVSAATTEVSEFMAAVNASNEYPAEYKYYKYLEAICGAYKNARLVIVGNDVDSSRLYFGSFLNSGATEEE